jgi:DNA-binding NtrC family response regulator
VIPLQILPLRQRREDIALLVSHFVKKYCNEQQLTLKQVSHDAMKHLMAFDWPGNVRQLENAIEMAVSLSGDRELLVLSDFPLVAKPLDDELLFRNIAIPEDGIHFNTLVSELERRLILQSLEVTGGNKKRAASLLHLKRTTFVEKLKRMGLETDPSEMMLLEG